MMVWHDVVALKKPYRIRWENNKQTKLTLEVSESSDTSVGRLYSSQIKVEFKTKIWVVMTELKIQLLH